MLTRSFHARRSHSSQSGVALILVLSFVVLLTIVVLVFLNRVTTARQLSNGSLNQSSADQIAVSALDVITGSLKQEIADPTNSVSTTYGSTTPYTVYEPKTSANVLPARFGNPSGTPDPIPNLVRISSRSDSTLPYPSQASAVNSTTDVSVNGRAVSLARWNSHYLIPLQNPSGAITNTTPVTAFSPPDWVLVSDTQGPTVLTTPNSAVIGRYAYAIYDEGGLLDANVAGFPSQSTTAQYGDKPGLAFADLTQLGLAASDVDNLVGWRNYASVQPSGTFGSFTLATSAQLQAFFNLITGNTSGFLTVNNAPEWNNGTDQAFLNRQELLKYCTSSNPSFPVNALQYLGTFSRDVNAPTWSPSTPAGSTINYAAQANATTSANRDVTGVRVVNSFKRADGTTAQVGEPLVKYRFPLNRLAGLTYKGMVTNDTNQGIDTTDNTTLVNGVVSPATAATIQRDFGLVYNAGNAAASYPHWNYSGPTGAAVQSSIATLDQVAQSKPGREPNFFELLKAAILSGSLGRDAGANGTYTAGAATEIGTSSGLQAADQNTDLQIIQIGTNIIDQAHADNYPTEIHFSNGGTDTAVYGVKNLPYLQRVFAKTLYNWTDASTQVTGDGGWLMAELWNPHQSFGCTASTTPSQFQFTGSGKVQMIDNTLGSDIDLTKSGAIQFTADPTLCRDPTWLANDSGIVPNITTNNTSSNPLTAVNGLNGSNNPWTWVVQGLYCGTVSDTTPAGGQPCGILPVNNPASPVNLFLQYKTPSGYYRTYCVMRNLTGALRDLASARAFYYEHVDPRTDRLGTTMGEWTYNDSNGDPVQPPAQSIRSNTGNGFPSVAYYPNSPAFTYSGSPIPGNFYMGTLSDNTTSSNPYYSDQDGIVRPGEGAYAVQGTGPPYPGYPLVLTSTNGSDSRPIILNRPFRNVGELGYAFRDLPWKNVDFFTPQSGDAGLLDFFCIQESTTTTPLVAGAVSLNTRQAPVLQAILAGAMKDEVNSVTIPSTDAATIANSLVAWTTSTTTTEGPFLNRSDLLTQAASTLVASTESAEDQQIKMRREAALRALSGIGTTRTWTLMIDVIAQTGHYPPGATGLAQFVVEGEKRYWLHVAIDRYTGQIVDRILEPVYE